MVRMDEMKFADGGSVQAGHRGEAQLRVRRCEFEGV